MTADQTPSYDARSALDDVATSREAVAERLVTPWWYHPVLGVLLASIVLVNALGLDSWVTIVVPLLAATGMGALAGAYKKATGLWVAPGNTGPRSRAWWSAYAVVVVVAVVLALAPMVTGLAYPTWVAWLLAAAVVVATVVLGRRIDAALRAEIRSGAAPLPRSA